MRAALACLLLAACATTEAPMPREKQGATEGEFMQARDVCMTESTMPFSDATMGTYPAAASSSSAQQAINCPKYDACMNGKGFQRADKGRFYAPILCRD